MTTVSAAFVLVCVAISANNGDGISYTLSEGPKESDLFVLQEQSSGAAPGAAANRPAAAPRPNDAAANNPRRPPAGGNPYARLARVPNMFGDSLPPTSNLFILSCDPNRPSSVVTEVLAGGGSRYIPIGENNKPLPMDRVYFLYNNFNNAVTTTNVVSGTAFDSNLQRYTMGYEKTFFDQQASLEIRFPLTSSIDTQFNNFNSSTGTVGNITLVSKWLLSKTESTAVATGLGLGLPTGSSFQGTSGSTNFQLTNQSVYLIPYIGVSHNLNENWFTTAYAQVEIAANGDPFKVEGAGTLGKLNAASFARFDVAMGRWLLRDMHYRYLNGVALVTEFHYITALNNGDVLSSNGMIGLCSVSLGATDNRVDYLNNTLGVHFQLTDLANLRVAGIFPMRKDPDRQFDSELQVSFNRMF